MKQICLFALAGLLVMNTSCRRSNCWKCTTVFRGNNGWRPPQTSAAGARYCNMTETEIRQLERDNTGSVTTTQNGRTITYHTTTTCK